jgi:hypothetical protein
MSKTQMTPDISTPLTLILETREQREILDETIIQQAMNGPVYILDAGNCFNPLRLTRSIRRRTLQIQAVLDRMQVARAFTCFQVVSLLDATIHPKGPVFILRLLATFNDEMIPTYERLRLLKQVDGHIERLQGAVPVVVTTRHTQFESDTLADWISELGGRADEVRTPRLGMRPEPARLF